MNEDIKQLLSQREQAVIEKREATFLDGLFVGAVIVLLITYVITIL